MLCADLGNLLEDRNLDAIVVLYRLGCRATNQSLAMIYQTLAVFKVGTGIAALVYALAKRAVTLPHVIAAATVSLNS